MNVTAGPLVSVVIPTYNHAHYLDRALQSVLDQTYTNWEAIAIDNHSTDNTDEVMGSFTDPRITYLKIHNNGVIAASRNMGIRAAKGEWIAFLDSDDWWTVTKLQVCFERINDNVDLIYHDLEIVRDPPVFFRKEIIKTWQVRKPVLMDLLVNGNALSNSSVVVRKRLLDEIGGIDENVDMIACEDYNAWLRIAQITDKFIYLPRSLGYYLLHDHGISRKDVSVPARTSVSKFIHLLDEQQKTKIESRFRYAKGRFSYVVGNYTDAKDNLLFSLRHGAILIKLKSVLSLMMIAYKKVTEFLFKGLQS